MHVCLFFVLQLLSTVQSDIWSAGWWPGTGLTSIESTSRLSLVSFVRFSSNCDVLFLTWHAGWLCATLECDTCLTYTVRMCVCRREQNCCYPSVKDRNNPQWSSGSSLESICHEKISMKSNFFLKNILRTKTEQSDNTSETSEPMTLNNFIWFWHQLLYDCKINSIDCFGNLLFVLFVFLLIWSDLFNV